MNQYFKFKIKDEYLPEIIKTYIQKDIIKFSYYGTYEIEQKYFRKLKIQNIQNEISEDDKGLIEYLINKDFVHLLTEDEFQKVKKVWGESCSTGTSGYSGTIGISGTSGTSGIVIDHSSKRNILDKIFKDSNKQRANHYTKVNSQSHKNKIYLRKTV